MHMTYISDTLRCKFIERFKHGISLIKKSDISFIECGCFGSFARNDFNCLSDIDFIVIVKDINSIDKGSFSSLKNELKSIDCDLAVLTEEHFNNPNTAFAFQVRKDYRRVL